MPGFESKDLVEKEEKLRLEKGKQRLSQEEEGECIGQAEEDENGSSQLSIAAVAWSDWHMRIYFQDGRGGVHEDAHDDGVWRFSGIRNPQKELFTARLHSHLCAISWDEGQQVSSEKFPSLLHLKTGMTIDSHLLFHSCGHSSGTLLLRRAWLVPRKSEWLGRSSGAILACVCYPMGQ